MMRSEQTTDPVRWQLPEAGMDLARWPSLASPDPGSARDAIRGLRESHRRFLACKPGAILLVIQGPDTSGKNSLLRHLARGLDPAGFRVCSFGPPAGEELEHDFLWRVQRRLPQWGELAGFNRSHYEAVLAERLWPVAQPVVTPDWAARRRAINDFERHLVESGTRVIKCWLHISEEEYRSRLLHRLDNPRKQWKFDASDLRTFRDRQRYQALAAEVLRETHTAHAPWYLIPSDRKNQARAIVAQILIQVLEELAPAYPEPEAGVLEPFRQALKKKG
jgi:PPK2 family polyphosphate:nucleotide phosphotransferase